MLPATDDSDLFIDLFIGLFGEADEQDEQGWQERALCAQTDPEAFFPEKGESTREAKRNAATCARHVSLSLKGLVA